MTFEVASSEPPPVARLRAALTLVQRRWVILLCGILLSSAAMGQLSDTSYRLVFIEEFNGTSVDTSKWQIASPTWTMPNSYSTATPSEVSVADGLLTLGATRTGTSGSVQFTGGSISGYQRHHFDGGYVEARIKLPTTAGSWAAFWGLYDGWPPEADILEYPLDSDGGAGYANTEYHTAFHYRNTSGGNSAGAGKVDPSWLGALNTDYHIFAMDWVSDTSVKFYIDGVQVQQFTSAADVAEMVNMYLILNHAVGGTQWIGVPSTAQWPLATKDRMQVDWVRIWQKTANGGTVSNWSVNGGGTFATSGNWSNSIAPAFGNQTAVFGSPGAAATAAITMPTWRVFGGMTFSGATAYTIGSSSNVIQLAGQPLGATANGSTVHVDSTSTVSQNINARLELWSDTTFRNEMTGGQTLNLNSELSGNGGFNVTGAGVTVLNAPGIYTGFANVGTAQEAATLRLNASSALGHGGMAIGGAGNGTTARLELTGGRVQPNAIDFRGRNNTSVGIRNVSGNNTLAGTISASAGGGAYRIESEADTLTLSGALRAASGARTFTLQGAGSGVVSGGIENGGGTVAMVKEGAGAWTFAGPGTYTGTTAVTGGTLRLVPTPAVASYSFDNVSGSTIVNAGSGGAAMNGILTGGAAVVAGGRFGNAVSLTGGAHVNINSPILDMANAGNWTVSAWVKTTAAGSTILSKSNGGTSWSTGNTIFYLGDGTAGGSGGIPSGVRWAGGFYQGATSATAVNDDAWHMVTYVNTGGVYAIYVDGVAQGLSPGNGGFGNADAGAVVRLGFTTSTGDGAVHFSGLLDDVQFYGQSLSSAQIALLYQGQAVAGSLPATAGVTVGSGATLEVNGVNQTIGSLSGAGTLTKTGDGTLTLTGANTFSGNATVSGGTLYANSANAATNRALSFVGGITVNSGGTLRASTNGLFGWDGTQERPITVNAGGALLGNGGLLSDVGVGTVTLNGGTISTLAAGATDYGSFRFDNPTDQLLVTENSAVSAVNVKFGTASASINVAADKVLNFTGSITNTTAGGVSYLTKTGPGTLILAAANDYTGATTITGGTLHVGGSLSGNSAVAIGAGATLTGGGAIAGGLVLSGGAIHAPAGIQSVGGAVNYGAGSRLKWSLTANSTAAGSASGVAAAGMLTITSGAIVDIALDAAGSAVDFTNAFWTQSRAWPVASGSSLASGGNFTLGALSNDRNNRPISDYGTLQFVPSASGVALVFTPYTAQQNWQRARFGADWNNPAVAGDLVDGDKDGLSNLLEYTLASDPAITSATAAPQVKVVGGKLTITFTRNPAATDVTLSVWGTDNLLPGSWTELARAEPGAPFVVKAADATVSENAGVVQVGDQFSITDSAHPTRALKLQVEH